jgi:hypothetical protein
MPRRRTHPLVEVDVEVVERDVGGGDEDVLDGGVEALEHGEVEHPRGLRVHGQVRGHLPPVRLRRRRRHRTPAHGTGGGSESAVWVEEQGTGCLWNKKCTVGRCPRAESSWGTAVHYLRGMGRPIGGSNYGLKLGKIHCSAFIRSSSWWSSWSG